MKSSFEIPRCYDSHVHFMATGVASLGLQLSSLRSAHDIKNIQVKDSHFRGDWLVGFGWDQYKWDDISEPNFQILDQVFPSFPVALTRADGHATWLNSKALERVGYLESDTKQKPDIDGGIIVRDRQGHPSGIFVDNAKIFVDMKIPDFSREQKVSFFKEAIGLFNRQGFTHIRDMSSSEESWNLLQELDRKKELTLYVDCNFSCENLNDFERALNELKRAMKNPSPHLKARGIKVYFDGALGSEGAFLSHPYPSGKSGFTLWPHEQIQTLMKRSWENNFEFSIHTIGDQAAAIIIDLAYELFQQNIRGPLNIEHCEILKPDAIEKISQLKATCYMQPCHWLTDRTWLKQKLGDLYQHVFPWAALEKKGATILWGSDSPIETPSVINNLKALKESPDYGIPAMKGDTLSHHSHPSSAWGESCRTVFKNNRVESVIFDQVEIFKN